MMDFNPYIEDLDDRLADVGQVRLCSCLSPLVLFAKDMPEQEGAPGNLFRGPLFAFVMVMIGTMTLLMTFYMLVAEYCGIGSPTDAQAAAGGVGSSLAVHPRASTSRKQSSPSDRRRRRRPGGSLSQHGAGRPRCIYVPPRPAHGACPRPPSPR